jgi:hypothetical protein
VYSFISTKTKKKKKRKKKKMIDYFYLLFTFRNTALCIINTSLTLKKRKLLLCGNDGENLDSFFISTKTKKQKIACAEKKIY